MIFLFSEDSLVSSRTGNSGGKRAESSCSISSGLHRNGRDEKRKNVETNQIRTETRTIVLKRNTQPDLILRRCSSS
jgi:hypothetical protein